MRSAVANKTKNAFVPTLRQPLLLGAALIAATTIAVSAKGPPDFVVCDEALTGFDNKTNGLTSQSVFDSDREAFDETEKIAGDGLGPVYNATSCVGCHQNAGLIKKSPPRFNSEAVSGTSSQVSEIRAGSHVTCSPNPFTCPGGVIFVDPPGGSVIHQRAIDPRIQERLPTDLPGEVKTTLRMATSTLGDGYVEAIRDHDILAVRAAQPAELRGTPTHVAVVTGKVNGEFKFESRIGRFGWKSQEASLLNFSAGAYVTEMGITSPLHEHENTSLGNSVADFDIVADVEDTGSTFGDDVVKFARFMRATKAPPVEKLENPDDKKDVQRGSEIFTELKCNVCHHPEFRTMRQGTYGEFKRVPNALACKRIRPYNDFLLHDIGTGDGIVQTQRAEYPATGITRPKRSPSDRVEIDVERLNSLLSGKGDPKNPERATNLSTFENETIDPAVQAVAPNAQLQSLTGRLGPVLPPLTTKTANMMRTAPLWGLRTRPQLLHDGRALTIPDAIKAHQGQAASVTAAYLARSDADKQKLHRFLAHL